jgi:hypothetical protein
VSRVRFGCLFLLLSSVPTLAQEASALSPRNANYTIEVTLNAAAGLLEGREVIEWRNIQPLATDELWLHLYWNAWRNNRSTWMLERRLAGRGFQRRSGGTGRPGKDDWSWIEVDAVRLLEGQGDEGTDLPRRFASPDDANPDDRTVMIVSLPGEVEPGESVRVAVRWRARIPRTFARTGYRGDFFFFGHWFPKLGVLEPEGWNCHQFHVATEFYSDYGVYDVHMTVPEGYVVGATGREVDHTDNPDGTVTHHYHEEDVHDFAWTASPNFHVTEERFEADGLPPVDIRLLIQPEHLGQASRYFAAARTALDAYGRWYGPYPYGHVTIVDPPYKSRAGGMEYPTLITCGTRRFQPAGTDRPESVTLHEMGHQFWYGIVGNNEFEHAWLDEGLVNFSTMRTLQTAYEDPPLVHRYLSGFVPIRFAEIRLQRWNRYLGRYREQGTADAPAEPSYRYHPATARAISYGKTAAWLATLERHLGWETLQEILSTFFERHKFDHPTPDDFFTVANEVAGQDLTWFFDQVHGDSVGFDYGVSSVRSSRVTRRGWGDPDSEGEPVRLEAADTAPADADREEGDGVSLVGADGEDDEAEMIYRTEVVVRRHGGGRFPVEVLLAFEDGDEIRQRWDGQGRWKMFVVERPSRLDYAAIDPDRVLVLDVDRSNNSRVREPKGRLPATKWGSKWMVWFQDYLSSIAFFM